MPMMDKLSPHRTMWTGDNDHGCVRYIHTDIVEWTADTITLRMGGWRTVTTKRKMNQAARQFGLGYSVYQKNHEWFLSLRNGRVLPFYDGMTVSRSFQHEAAA